MAIDENKAKREVQKVEEVIQQLNLVKNQLKNQSNLLTQNWKSDEITYIVAGYNLSISSVDKIITKLNAIKTSISGAIDVVIQEETSSRNASNNAHNYYESITVNEWLDTVDDKRLQSFVRNNLKYFGIKLSGKVDKSTIDKILDVWSKYKDKLR